MSRVNIGVVSRVSRSTRQALAMITLACSHRCSATVISSFHGQRAAPFIERETTDLKIRVRGICSVCASTRLPAANDTEILPRKQFQVVGTFPHVVHKLIHIWIYSTRSGSSSSSLGCIDQGRRSGE